MLNTLEYIREMSWDEIFEGWRTREADDPAWQQCATQVKGWESWEAWREFMADQFEAKNRRWKLYKVLDPAQVIPQWLIGPTQGWQNLFKDQNVELFRRSFARLAELNLNWIEKNEKIREIALNFPSPTQMIGFHLPHQNQIMCFEGHHRSAAIALAQALDQPISLKEVYVVLTDFEEGEGDLISKMIERGSDKVKIELEPS